MTGLVNQLSDIQLYLCLSVVVCLFAGTALFIIHRKKNQSEEQHNKQVKNLLGEIRILRDQLEGNTLRYNLNPHFVFNSLNNLQYFINSGEKKIALSYVSRFSKFMRQIILLAGAPKGTLQEEATILRQYLELEKLRFEDKFDFTVTVPENLSFVNISIPAMSLYHVVENIIYGRALNSTNHVHIKINFEYMQDRICFTVEDNAVIAAADNKYATQPNKLAEQLQALNETNDGKIQAQINSYDNARQLVEVKFYIENAEIEELAA